MSSVNKEKMPMRPLLPDRFSHPDPVWPVPGDVLSHVPDSGIALETPPAKQESTMMDPMFKGRGELRGFSVKKG